MNLHNKTIFITGATSGFGLACAKLFAAQGAKVIATGRRGERLAALKKELGDAVHPLTLDMRDRQAVEQAVSELPEGFSEIDVLVNNAGGALGLSSFDKADLDDAEQMIDANIKGLVYCTHAVLPGMVARNRGHIINLSSVAGSYPYPGGNVYGGTKAFVTQFSLNLRADLLGKNIRITSVEPGLAETEFSLVRFHGDAEKAAATYKGVKPLSAEDIANTILWIVTQPEHVNVNRIELMPTQQAFSAFAVHRDKS